MKEKNVKKYYAYKCEPIITKVSAKFKFELQRNRAIYYARENIQRHRFKIQKRSFMVKTQKH